MTDSTPFPTPAAGEPLTVTLFGDNGRIDHAINDELERRGCRSHSVTVATGWLSSATHVVVRPDTPAGARALRDLGGILQPAAHVIVVCEEQVDAAQSAAMDDLCRQCGITHDISLLWHAPIPQPIAEALPAAPKVLPTDELAAAVADDMIALHDPAGPSFQTRVLQLSA